MFRGIEAAIVESDDLTHGRCKIISEIFKKRSGTLTDTAELKPGGIVFTGSGTRRFKTKHLQLPQKSGFNFYSVDWIADSIKKGQLLPMKDYAIKIEEQQCGSESSDSLVEVGTELAAADDADLAVELNLPECQRQTPLQSEYNQDLIVELEIIAEARYLTGNSRSHQSYRRAISILKAYPKRLQTAAEAEKMRGIGGKLAYFIGEFLKSGSIGYSRTLKADEKLQVLRQFCKIHGVGPATANKWYDEGLRSVEEVEARRAASLTSQQQLGIRYFADFNTPMTREEVGSVAGSIAKEMEKCLDTSTTWHLQITGGYSRGKLLNNDVDLIIWPEDETKTTGQLQRLVKHLRGMGLIKEIILFHSYNPRQFKHKRIDEDQYDKVQQQQQQLEMCEISAKLCYAVLLHL